MVTFSIDCPEPPNPWVVAGSILGGVVFLGLVILALIKIIIYVISRREVKEWEKERKHTAITSVSIHTFMDSADIDSKALLVLWC